MSSLDDADNADGPLEVACMGSVPYDLHFPHKPFPEYIKIALALVFDKIGALFGPFYLYHIPAFKRHVDLAVENELYGVLLRAHRDIDGHPVRYYDRPVRKIEWADGGDDYGMDRGVEYRAVGRKRIGGGTRRGGDDEAVGPVGVDIFLVYAGLQAHEPRVVALYDRVVQDPVAAKDLVRPRMFHMQEHPFLDLVVV